MKLSNTAVILSAIALLGSTLVNCAIDQIDIPDIAATGEVFYLVVDGKEYQNYYIGRDPINITTYVKLRPQFKDAIPFRLNKTDNSIYQSGDPTRVLQATPLAFLPVILNIEYPDQDEYSYRKMRIEFTQSGPNPRPILHAELDNGIKLHLVQCGSPENGFPINSARDCEGEPCTCMPITITPWYPVIGSDENPPTWKEPRKASSDTGATREEL